MTSVHFTVKNIALILLFIASINAQITSVNDTTEVKKQNVISQEKPQFQLFKLYGGEHRSSYLSMNSLLPHQTTFLFKGFSLSDHFNGSFVETRFQNKLYLIDGVNATEIQLSQIKADNIKSYSNVTFGDGSFNTTLVDVSYRQKISETTGIYLGFNNFEPNAPNSDANIEAKRKQTQIRLGTDYKMGNVSFDVDYQFYRNTHSDYGLDLIARDETSLFNEVNEIEDLFIISSYKSYDFGLSRSKHYRTWFDFNFSNKYTSTKTNFYISKHFEKHDVKIEKTYQEVMSESYLADRNVNLLNIQYQYKSTDLNGSIRVKQTNDFQKITSPLIDLDLSYKFNNFKLSTSKTNRLPNINESRFYKDTTDFSVPHITASKVTPNMSLSEETTYTYQLKYNIIKDHNVSFSGVNIYNPIRYNPENEMFVNSEESQAYSFTLSGLFKLHKEYSLNLSYLNQINKTTNSHLPDIYTSLNVSSEFHLLRDSDIRLNFGGQFYSGKKELIFNRYTGIYGFSSVELDNFFMASFKAEILIKSAIISFEMRNPFGINYNLVNGYSGNFSGAFFTIDWTFND